MWYAGNRRWGIGLLAVVLSMSLPVQANDLLEDPSQWRVQVSEGAKARVLRGTDDLGRSALCLEWDFGVLPGSVQLVRQLPEVLPSRLRMDYRQRLQVAEGGQASVHLEAGDQRRWSAYPLRSTGLSWQARTLVAEQFRRASGEVLTRALPLKAVTMQWRVASPLGGRGQWCLSGMSVVSAPEAAPLTVVSVLADTATALQQRMIDGRADTLWVSTGAKQQSLSADLGRLQEVSGLSIQWAPEMRASTYRIQASEDGRRWTPLRHVREATGTIDAVRFGPLQSRFLRVDMQDGPNWRYGIVELQPYPAAWGRDLSAWLTEVGRHLPPRVIPPSVTGGRVQWRPVAASGATSPAWFSAQGAIETFPGQFSVVPRLRVDGQWLDGWSAQAVALNNHDGSVSSVWNREALDFRVTAMPGQDGQGRPWLRVDYSLKNPYPTARAVDVAIGIEPFLVQPAGLQGDLAGGVGRLERLQVDADRVLANGRPVMMAVQPADTHFTSHFDAGLAAARLQAKGWTETTAVDDEQGLASGVMLWSLRLEPEGGGRIRLWLPMAAQGIAAVAAPAMFSEVALVPSWQLPDEDGQRVSAVASAAVQRMLAEATGGWLRSDSRLSIGAANRDAMAIGQALWRAGEYAVVREWLLARKAVVGSGRCEALQHWLMLAGDLEGVDPWSTEQRAALQPWLEAQRISLGESGRCLGELSAPVRARALEAVARLLPPPEPQPAPELASPATGGMAGEEVSMLDMSADSPVMAVSTMSGVQAEVPIAMPVALSPVLLPVGSAAPLKERQQRWQAALAVAGGAPSLAGWVQWDQGSLAGMRDAREAADTYQQLVAVWMDDAGDALRLLPGLPAHLWATESWQLPMLATRWGQLGMRGYRDGDDLVIELAPGLHLPPAGVVLDWPWRAPPGAVLIDGVPAVWQGGRLQFDAGVRQIRIELPLDQR